MARRAPSEKPPASASGGSSDANLALVWGGDEYRVAEKAREILTAWCPVAQQEFGVEKVDGAVESSEEAISAIQRVVEAMNTVGLFGGSKVVWLQDASFFTEAVPGKFENVKAAVARLVEEIKGGLMPGQRLLISAPGVHRGYGFYKACQAHGVVIERGFPDRPKEQTEYALATVQELLKEEGLRASPSTLHALVNKAGYETRLLVQEVRKLATYLGDRRDLTLDDVRSMVSPSRESAVWDLAEVLAQRDLAGSLRLFRQLLFQKENPVLLLMGIEGRVRDMLALKALQEKGYLRISGGSYANAIWADSPEAREAAAALAGSLLKGHPYRLTKLAQSAEGFSLGELRRWHRLAVQAHERLMVGGVSDEVVLELMMVNMVRGGGGA